jgi:hypothetical protein
VVLQDVVRKVPPQTVLHLHGTVDNPLRFSTEGNVEIKKPLSMRRADGSPPHSVVFETAMHNRVRVNAQNVSFTGIDVLCDWCEKPIEFTSSESFGGRLDRMGVYVFNSTQGAHAGFAMSAGGEVTNSIAVGTWQSLVDVTEDSGARILHCTLATAAFDNNMVVVTASSSQPDGVVLDGNLIDARLATVADQLFVGSAMLPTLRNNWTYGANVLPGILTLPTSATEPPGSNCIGPPDGAGSCPGEPFAVLEATCDGPLTCDVTPPQSSPVVEQGGAGVLPPDRQRDYLDKLRPANASIGALEPN